jgi:hypothetical protein
MTDAVGAAAPLGAGGKVVPGERFELPTNGLQNRCSTTELTRHINDLEGLVKADCDPSAARGLRCLEGRRRSIVNARGTVSKPTPRMQPATTTRVSRGPYLKATRVDSRMTRPAGFQCVRQSATGTPRSPEERLQRLQGQPGRRDGSECDHKREMNDHAAPPIPTADTHRSDH